MTTVSEIRSIYIINMCTFIIGISGILVLALYRRQHAPQRTT